jgi:tyrosine-protein phosphatase non-receptor type 23
LTNCLTFSSDVINGKLEISKKENEFVYHEKVPDFDTLPELKGASLVRGIGFEVSDPEISGPDIFGRLVPLEAHETSSMYRYEKISPYFRSFYLG